MSRQIQFPLLKWRQGAQPRFISQTTWAINPMSLYCTRSAFFNPLLLMNWLGVGSVAAIWALGSIDLKPARANLPEQQTTHLELGRVAGLTDNGKPRNTQDSKALAQQSATVPSIQRPVPQPVFVGYTSAPVVKEYSVTPASPPSLLTHNTTSGSTSKVEGLGAPPVQAATQDTPKLNSEQLTAASGGSCTPGITCSDLVPSRTRVLPSNTSNTTLAQLPYLPQPPQPLPVPATPIPVGSNNSNTTLGQLPYSAQPQNLVPLTATGVPVSSTSYNPGLGQPSYYPQTVLMVPMMVSPSSGGMNSYNPGLGQPSYYPQTVLMVPMMVSPSSGGVNGYNPTANQAPYYPPTVPTTAYGNPGGVNGYNPMAGQSPFYPQTVPALPAPLTPNPVGSNGYNPVGGQFPYYPQTVPTTVYGNPGGVNGYNPVGGQAPYYPQTVPTTVYGNPGGVNGYNPMAGQSPFYPQNYPQTVPALPVQTPNSAGSNGYNPLVGAPYYPQTVPTTAYSGSPGGVNGYNPMTGQFPYSPQAVPPLPAPLTPNPVGSDGYNPMAGQSSNYPRTVPITAYSKPGGMNSYNPMAGQSPYSPPTVPSVPAPPTPNPVGSNGYNPAGEQPPYFPQNSPPPYAPNFNLVPPAPTPTTLPAPTPVTPPAPTSPTTLLAPTQQPSSLRSTAVTAPYLRFQGAYENQGEDTAARARLTGLYPLNSRVQFGGTLDLISGDNIFSDSRGQGLNINELYVATAPFSDLPNLRLVVGQLDLTSYFDRNSFAKDGVTHFFNPVFQTNPALSTTGIFSHPSVLVNWSVTDNIEAKAAVFSSSRSIGDFSLDGFAGEIGFRYGNAIVRGTYATDRDAGNRDGFQEIFQVNRGNGRTGLLRSDREEAYGINGEYFFPKLNMGLFARYGRYENQALNLGGNTYSFGISFLDLFTKNDRLGLAYGRGLSNEQLRRNFKDDVPDVLELFYDFRFLPNIRLGVTLQQRNDFSETYGGFRVKTEFDVTPGGKSTP